MLRNAVKFIFVITFIIGSISFANAQKISYEQDIEKDMKRLSVICKFEAQEKASEALLLSLSGFTLYGASNFLLSATPVLFFPASIFLYTTATLTSLFMIGKGIVKGFESYSYFQKARSLEKELFFRNFEQNPSYWQTIES